MLAIEGPIEFADLLDRLDVQSEREAWLAEADVDVKESVADEGVRFWRRHYA